MNQKARTANECLIMQDIYEDSDMSPTAFKQQKIE